MTDAIGISHDAGAPARKAARASTGPRSYLFNPVVDFLCLGGGSLLVIIPMLLMADQDLRPAIALGTFFAAQVINQPHFAHSYQIFYSRFREKLLGEAYPPFLRARYALSGIVVPLSMILFFAVCYVMEDAKLLGLTGNLLALTVGWHYVKQGYGILMVECVLKRCFFNDREKARLKLNAYVIWLTSWIYVNHLFQTRQYQGLEFYTFDFPDWLLAVVTLLAAGSTALILITVAVKAIGNGGRLAYNGLLAYFASVYVWIYAIYTDPILLLIVPVFHSIQYLAVVWRYQLNKARAQYGDTAFTISLPGGQLSVPRYVARLIRFIVIGIALGAIGFHAAPYVFTATASGSLVFGPTTFVIMFFIFFNVHHFFLDNVMWRKENPDIKQHLFTPA